MGDEQGRSPRWLLAAVGCAILAIDSAALADPPAPPPVDEAHADEEAARAHFDRGIRLSREGAWEEALAELRASLALFPRRVNPALAAAVCLQDLRRYDEALELLEPLLSAPGATLDPKRRATVESRIAELRAHVGTITFEGGEPGATVVIDGRYRGTLPLPAPLRAVEGSHVLQIFKAGSEPFGAVVEVKGGQTAVARLASLSTTAGRLRVTEAQGRALSVVIDGRVVGKTPWEGSVAAGEHLVELRGKANLGTAPVSVSVAVRRVTPLKLLAEDLGATLRVEPVPAGASVAIDAVSVGSGVWEGHLRVGRHQIEVAAAGFLPASRQIELRRGAREVISVALSRDVTSPFWRRPPRFVAELSAGALVVPTFGGAVAGTCVQPCRGGVGVGSYSALRGGYELGPGLGFGLSVGGLTATQTIRDRTTSLNIVGRGPRAGLTEDVLKLQGISFGGWLRYTVDVGLPIHVRLGAGGLVGSASDARRGSFTTSNGVAYGVGTYAESGPARFVFVTPEVRVGWPLGKHVELNAGLELPILFQVLSPVWGGQDRPINAGPDGYGWFGPDAFVGGALFTLAPTVGARFDL